MITYIVADYLLIGTYVVLVLIALRNIWVILVKQKEYKNEPILMFYCFSIISLTLRPIVIIFWWKSSPYQTNIDFVQVASKFCVGVVQDWITLELAVRIRNSNGVSDISA